MCVAMKVCDPYSSRPVLDGLGERLPMMDLVCMVIAYGVPLKPPLAGTKDMCPKLMPPPEPSGTMSSHVAIVAC